MPADDWAEPIVTVPVAWLRDLAAMSQALGRQIAHGRYAGDEGERKRERHAGRVIIQAERWARARKEQ